MASQSLLKITHYLVGLRSLSKEIGVRLQCKHSHSLSFRLYGSRHLMRTLALRSNVLIKESQVACYSTNDNALSLTDACIKQINKIVEPGSSLRVVVESGGCSGFQYKFEMTSDVSNDDRVFERDGARVVIDPDSLDLIRGSVIDFKNELIRSAFSVSSNPQAETGCSCGASFNVKV